MSLQLADLEFQFRLRFIVDTQKTRIRLVYMVESVPIISF